MGDEEVLSIRNSRKVYIPIYSLSIILLLIILFLRLQGFALNKIAIWAIALFVFLGIIGTEINRVKNKYEINPNSVVHIEGYLNKVAKRLDLFAVSDIDVSQTWWQRLLNFGNVNVHLFSIESTTAIKNINNPKQFALALEEQMTKRRTGGFKKDV